MIEFWHAVNVVIHSPAADILERLLTITAILLAVAHERTLNAQVGRFLEITNKLGTVESELGEQASKLSVVETQLGAQATKLSTVESHLGAQVRQMDEIRSAIRTYPLGNFPNYLNRIAQLVARAERRVVVCCDFPAYGSFSDPDSFLAYHQAIAKKIARKVHVEIACLGPEARRKSVTREQFAKAGSWEKMTVDRHEDFKRYLTVHKGTDDLSSLTQDEFLQMIVDEDTLTLQGSFGGAIKYELRERPPVYFWLIDDAMVFVIPSPVRLMEHGFITHDLHFIDGLCDIAERYTPLRFPERTTT
ncbi:MAG: hypothetical protein QOI58_4007 [Thermoanaerobaculia bacterium]|jgi:hypothetical protein|nr:hypothetical protein [Thermoanaerobaculia bacterium]